MKQPKVKTLKLKKNNLPLFLNFILYNEIDSVDESVYSYPSKRVNGREYYVNNDKHISTIINYDIKFDD